MASYAAIYDKAHNIDFVNRVESAVVEAALAISAEDAQTANHANRVALAKQVLQAPKYWSEVMASGVASNATVQNSPNDANLLAAVNANWNAYAGAA